MRILYYITLLLAGIVLWTAGSEAAINMTVSPIKYELEWDPWQSITYTATLFNNDPTPVDIITGTSDFKPDGTTWSPSFVRYSELIHQDQEISSWITLSSPGFTIGWNTSHTINFTIDIPANATPGGHYGAVFFKNNNSETSWWSAAVGLNVDYGILILLTVSGEVDTQITITDPIITPNGWGGWWGSSGWGGWSSGWGGWAWNTQTWNLVWGNGTDTSDTNWDDSDSDNNNTSDTTDSDSNDNSDTNQDNTSANNNTNSNNNNNNNTAWGNGTDQCIIDFTSSNFDGKCFDDPLDAIEELILNDDEDDDFPELTSAEDIENIDDDFGVGFTFPVINTWNTHVKPEWSITLVDENGTTIKGIGKEPKINDKWAVIWMEVVDYIPINSGRWNVLPGSQRNFEAEWNGFPYQTLDDEWKIVMKDMSPHTYYTKKNIGEWKILMPWQRVCTKKNEKHITAYIKMSYLDDDGQTIEYNSAKEIPVSYTEKYIGLNPYVIIPFFIFLIIFFILWLIALGKRRKCVNKKCKKKIKRKLERCPHCNTKQKKLKKKKYKR